MNLNNDQRKMDGMQILEKFVFPALVAAGAAGLAIQITLATMEVDVDYIKRDVERQAVALATVTQIQLDLTALQIQAKNDSADIDYLKSQMALLRERLRRVEAAMDK